MNTYPTLPLSETAADPSTLLFVGRRGHYPSTIQRRSTATVPWYSVVGDS